MSAKEASGNDVVLQVSEVTVSYGGVIAVDEVTFDVPRGEILGLIGPNGAGKTTLFDAICGFAPMDRGRIVLAGNEVTDLTPAQRSRVGLARSFQDARLFSSLTVAEILSCALERKVKTQGPISTLLGLPWVWSAERDVHNKVEELIELLHLGAFRDKFASELSTGSRRIVDLACVLAHEPEVLLLDEPSSGIAQRETEAMGPLLKRVKEATGCTMLLIEHDMPLVTSVSDELIALETGRVIARGTPKAVTNDPRVVEAYLGTDERVVARSGAVAAPNGKAAKKKTGRRKVAKRAAKPKPARAPGAKAKTAQRTAKAKTAQRTAKAKTAQRKRTTSGRASSARRSPAPSKRKKG